MKVTRVEPNLEEPLFGGQGILIPIGNRRARSDEVSGALHQAITLTPELAIQREEDSFGKDSLEAKTARMLLGEGGRGNGSSSAEVPEPQLNPQDQAMIDEVEQTYGRGSMEADLARRIIAGEIPER